MKRNDLLAEVRDRSSSSSTSVRRNEAPRDDADVYLPEKDRLDGMKRYLQKLGAASYGCQVQVKSNCSLDGRRGRVLSFASVQQPIAPPAAGPNAMSSLVNMSTKLYLPRVVCVCEIEVDGEVQVATLDSEHLVRVPGRPANFCLPPKGVSAPGASPGEEESPWRVGALVRFIGKAHGNRSAMTSGLLNGSLGTISSVDMATNSASVYVADGPEQGLAERGPALGDKVCLATRYSALEDSARGPLRPGRIATVLAVRDGLVLVESDSSKWWYEAAALSYCSNPVEHWGVDPWLNWPNIPKSFQIPVDRVYDVQWMSSGFELSCTGLRQPPLDTHDRKEGGHYQFSSGTGKISFWRVLPNGQMNEVFERVRWVVVGDDALLIEGDGMYGTLVKGVGLPGGDNNVSLAMQKYANGSDAFHWLRSQFGGDWHGVAPFNMKDLQIVPQEPADAIPVVAVNEFISEARGRPAADPLPPPPAGPVSTADIPLFPGDEASINRWVYSQRPPSSKCGTEKPVMTSLSEFAAWRDGKSLADHLKIEHVTLIAR